MPTDEHCIDIEEDTDLDVQGDDVEGKQQADAEREEAIEEAESEHKETEIEERSAEREHEAAEQENPDRHRDEEPYQ